MNKYLRRGIISTIVGLGLCMLGLYLMADDFSFYKWILVIGVIFFGFGFLTVLYSLIRKIERRSLLDERKKHPKDSDE